MLVGSLNRRYDHPEGYEPGKHTELLVHEEVVSQNGGMPEVDFDNLTRIAVDGFGRRADSLTFKLAPGLRAAPPSPTRRKSWHIPGTSTVLIDVPNADHFGSGERVVLHRELFEKEMGGKGIGVTEEIIAQTALLDYRRSKQGLLDGTKNLAVASGVITAIYFMPRLAPKLDSETLELVTLFGPTILGVVAGNNIYKRTHNARAAASSKAVKDLLYDHAADIKFSFDRDKMDNAALRLKKLGLVDPQDLK